MVSVSIEDFIKNIYLIGREAQQLVTSSLLAERLGISSAGVTDMARKLAKKGLVDYQKYKELKLTAEGEQMALAVIRRHRLWELFLHRVLGMDLQQVHLEAERLEHQASVELLNAIDHYLGQPQFDPHGDPIPDKEGRMPSTSAVMKLSTMEEGCKGRIVRLTYADQEFAAFYDRYGIQLDKTIDLVKRFVIDGSCEIRLGDQIIVVTKTIAEQIYCVMEK